MRAFSLVLALCATLAAPAWALPPGGQVSTVWKGRFEVRAIATDPQGTLYLITSDRAHHQILKRTPEGRTSVLLDEARHLADPGDLAVDARGNLYFSDVEHHVVRRLSPQGDVTVLAGNGRGYQDGTGAEARFSSPQGLAIDAQGNLYVADSQNHRIRRITPEGRVSTLAGADFLPGKPHEDGPRDQARFYYPRDVAVHPDGTVFVADTGNNCIRKITPKGSVTTWAGKPGTGKKTFGNADGPGSEARFRLPRSLVLGASGTLYVADLNNSRIRGISPDGRVATVAGSSVGKADGPLLSARFRSPIGLALAPQGGLLVADSENCRVCLLDGV